MGEALVLLNFTQSMLSFFYWGAAALFLYLAIKKARTMTRKIVYAAVLIVAFGYWPTATVIAQQDAKRYREAAWAHFRERCKNAGEKIYRTVDDVEALFLLKPRKRPSEADLRDQYWMGDPYAFVLNPEVEVSRYLHYLNQNNIPTKRQTNQPGYRFVETPNATGSGLLRFELLDSKEGLSTTRSDIRRSAYGVSWDDISTKEDRGYWIAGSRLQVIDLSTKEVLAERIGYLFDHEFGSTTGSRAPWLHARLYAGSKAACPPIQRNAAMDRLFVEKVLKPKRGIAHGQ